MKYEDVIDLIGRYYRKQKSKNPLKNANKSSVEYFYDCFSDDISNMIEQMESVMNSNSCGATLQLQLPDKENGRLVDKNILKVKKLPERYGNYVQISIYEMNAIEFRRGKKNILAKIIHSKRPILDFAINLSNDIFYYRWSTSRIFPLRITGYIDKVLFEQERIRYLFIDLLRLSEDKYPIIKDVIRSIDKHGFLGSKMPFDEIVKYHNKNEMWNSVLRKKLPLNFNRLSIFEGTLVACLAQFISEDEYSLFCQRINNGILDKVIEGEVRGHGMWIGWIDERPYNNPINEHLINNFLYNHYSDWGVVGERKDDYGNDNILFDYIRLCEELNRPVSLRFHSINRIKREHDDMVKEIITMEGTEGDKKVNTSKSKFLKLREKLPPEFEWIVSEKRMWLESYTQHNCVKAYFERVEYDRCAIYHWEKGEKKYTIEFLKNEDGYCLGQMKKKYNEEADYEDYEYVKGLIA